MRFFLLLLLASCEGLEDRTVYTEVEWTSDAEVTYRVGTQVRF